MTDSAPALHIGYLNQEFPPEVGAGPARVLEMAKYWQAGGARVTVITAMPNRRLPERGEGGIDRGYRGKFFMIEEWEGIRVLRSWLFTGNGRGTATKLVNNASFMMTSLLHTLARRESFDVLIGSSPPFLPLVSATMLARMKHIPLVLELRDLWPDYLVQLDMVKNKGAQNALFGLEKWLLHQAARTVVVTESFRRRVVEKGVDPSDVDVVPNGVDLDEYYAATEPPPLPAVKKRAQEFLVGYLGTFGKGQALETVVRAAQLTSKTDPAIRFVLVGDGPQKPSIVREIRRSGLDNISVHPPILRRYTRAFYNACDVCVVPLAPVPIFSETVPSKMFEIMACQRPVVAAVHGEAGVLLERSGAGIRTDPGNEQALVQALLQVRAMSDAERAHMGRRGREYVAANYDRRLIAERYLAILSRVARRKALGVRRLVSA